MPTAQESDFLTLGSETGTNIDVSIGPKFLQLFSEQLYTSPNKAFEELVSNSWDAGATVVYLGIPAELGEEGAALWALDNGVSMDEEGMKWLWAVGDDHKARDDWEKPLDRDQIGKFGIGKLATYVLANQLTYICKAADGVIRAVSIDFREILKRADEQKLHMEPMPLAVRVIEEDELEGSLKALGLTDITDLISDGGVVPYKKSKEEKKAVPADEFHADETPATKTSKDSATWTLAVLSALKPRGEDVSKSHVKRMLRAALPLGDTIELVLDQELLTSYKADAQVQETWVLGADFAPASVKAEVKDVDDARDVEVSSTGGKKPYLEIEGVGKVTGEIRMYEKSIAGGKSEERGASNGFAVNICGRIVNLHDPHFGLPALSHASWAKIRIAVRADGLNEDLAVSREAVEDTVGVENFRGFLRACFNFARAHYAEGAKFPDIHELLRDEWGIVPISPLLHAVERAVEGGSTLDMIDLGEFDAGEESSAAIRADIEANPERALNQVDASPQGPDERLTRYRVSDRTVVINSDHPYWIEQLNGEIDKRDLLGIAATVNLLSDAYLLEMGVDLSFIDELRDYRDQVERVIAVMRRQSAPMLAKLLDDASNDSKALEKIVADCLDRLGFDVFPQGQRNKPEGIATAVLAPDDKDNCRRYRFIYEAKSTDQLPQKIAASTVGTGTQDRHRRHAHKDTDDETKIGYALIVAPDFHSGALEDESEELKLCPMRCRDLGKLLMGSAATGTLDLTKFERVLQCTGPDDVAEAIDKLLEEQQKEQRLNLQELVDALGQFDDVARLNVGMISAAMRARRQKLSKERVVRPNETDVRELMNGLKILAPSAVQVIGDQVVLGTSPSRLAEAIRRQTAALPAAQRFQLDELAGPEDAEEIEKEGARSQNGDAPSGPS